MKCANYMNMDAIRMTVKQHHEEWGPRDEPMSYDLSDLNLVRLCSVCDFGGTGSPVLDQVVCVLDEEAVGIQKLIKRLTGEPLKRVCFKELVQHDRAQGVGRGELPVRDKLSPRELQVLRLIAQQGSNSLKIGEELGISPNTVRGALLSARRVLGARNGSHAIAIAMSRDLI